MTLRELHVRLQFSTSDLREVGVLAARGAQTWFVFDPAFVAAGLEISPIRLPLTGPSAPRAHAPRPGVPIPGVFNDARPEGWGLKLLHRAFQQHGRPRSSVSPLDELAFLGDRTMGALVFEPATGPSGPIDDAIALRDLAAHAQAVWDDRVEDVLPSLLRAGGPSGGARPKALIGLPDADAHGARFGEGDLPPGWGAWLVKFPTAADDRDVGRRELAWMRMARAAGLLTPDARTFALEGVGDAFAVRRFDRPEPGARRHMLSAAGALDADFRTPGADYEHLLRVTARICRDAGQVEQMFRLAVFNVAAGNEDDHLKNFAFVLGPDGVWTLSPAYDLTWAPGPSGERCTTVDGAGKDVGAPQLLAVAAKAGIKAPTARRIVDEVRAATAQVGSFLDEVGCGGRVSRAARAAVLANTARLAP